MDKVCYFNLLENLIALCQRENLLSTDSDELMYQLEELSDIYFNREDIERDLEL